MRVWLIGADQSGANAIRQLRKNPELEIVVSDTIERPRAVVDRVIERVDYVESVNSLNIGPLIRRTRPDLILIDSRATQRMVSNVQGGVAFAESLQDEMAAASDVPVLII
jgi:hypothetical protein